VNLGGALLPNAGANDIFVAKYSSTGTYVWANHYGGIGADSGNAVAVDAAGNVFVTGAFQFTTDFGGGLLTTVATYSGYLTKLSSAAPTSGPSAGTAGTIKGTG